jgi:F-type H+-transporting ATPase subunit b
MIDWTTVVLQIINFLIIVWILKKYLFTPVLNAMDRRERAIHDRLAEAEQMKNDAGEERRALEAELTSLERKRAELIAAAHADAETERGSIMRSFNKDMEERRDAELRELEEERAELMKSVSNIAAKSVIYTASAAFKDLANSSIEHALIENFATRATRKNIADVSELKKYYKKTGCVLVNASFKLDELAKKRIRAALSKLLGEPVRAKFGLDENIVCGLEVVCDSIVISFGLGDYMAKLKRELDDELANATRTKPRKKRKG